MAMVELNKPRGLARGNGSCKKMDAVLLSKGSKMSAAGAFTGHLAHFPSSRGEVWLGPTSSG